MIGLIVVKHVVLAVLMMAKNETPCAAPVTDPVLGRELAGITGVCL